MKDGNSVQGELQCELQCGWIVYTVKIYFGKIVSGPADRLNMIGWEKGGLKDDYSLSG